jgi:hypothetical protein
MHVVQIRKVPQTSAFTPPFEQEPGKEGNASVYPSISACGSFEGSLHPDEQADAVAMAAANVVKAVVASFILADDWRFLRGFERFFKQIRVSRHAGLSKGLCTRTSRPTPLRWPPSSGSG